MAYGLSKSANFVPASSQFLDRATNLGIGVNVTLEAWINVTNPPSSGTIYGICAVRGTTNLMVFGMEYANNAGTLQFGVRYNQNNVASNATYFTKTFTAGTWYHVSMTYDGTTIKGQIDGTEVISQAFSGSGSGAPNSEFKIGNGMINPSEGTFWDGNISLVRAWSTALSNATLDANKCTVYGTATSNMLGEWSLDNVLTDSSGSGFTLTNNGTVTFTTALPATCTAGTGSFRKTLLGVGI